MDEHNFLLVVETTLQNLADQLEDHLAEHLQADLENGVLTITLDPEETYVLNRQLPKRQIWMSSPLSGATHFSYHEDTGTWLSSKDSNLSLPDLLATELRQITGAHFYFE